MLKLDCLYCFLYRLYHNPGGGGIFVNIAGHLNSPNFKLIFCNFIFILLIISFRHYF